MSRREREEMRRSIGSRAEEGWGKSEVNSIRPRQCSHPFSISIQPLLPLSHSDCLKWPWLNQSVERWALDTGLSAIESQYAAMGERSHLSMGMGNCCSQSKGGIKERPMQCGYVFTGKMKLGTVVRERRKKRDEIESRGLVCVYVHVPSMIFGLQLEPNHT